MDALASVKLDSKYLLTTKNDITINHLFCIWDGWLIFGEWVQKQYKNTGPLKVHYNSSVICMPNIQIPTGPNPKYKHVPRLIFKKFI